MVTAYSTYRLPNNHFMQDTVAQEPAGISLCITHLAHVQAWYCNHTIINKLSPRDKNMESLFLAQLLGVYFVIVGVVVLLRRGSLMPALSELAKNRPLILILALIELIAGIEIVLAYPNGAPAITTVKLVSKPSRRLYAGYRDFKKIRQGYGMAVVSTPAGILDTMEAKRKKVGGQLLFEIW